MAQIAVLVIFVLMFVLIVSEKIERHYVTLGCGVLVLAVVFGLIMRSADAVWSTLNLKSIITSGFWIASASEVESSTGINWATIIFVFGMMIMVEGMSDAGFFRWLCLSIAKAVKYKAMSVFVTFMIMAAVLSMFIDSITVILFLAAVTVELSKFLKFNPVPMILAEIFCANLGGSATMCGDPPNIIIGTSFGYSFFDFVVNTGLIAAIGIVLMIIYYVIVFRKEFSAKNRKPVDLSAIPSPTSVIKNKFKFTVSCGIFAIAVALLVTHANTGFSVAFIGAVIAAITLIFAWKDAWRLIKKVDFKTLLFFVGLFIVVGGLEQTGVLTTFAEFIAKLCGGNTMLMVAIIIWVSGIASAFVDNIPFAATMVPVIRSLAATQGVDLEVLTWSLAIGADIGGSATPIGASANVVGISMASKAGHTIGWGKYVKSALPATIIVLVVATIVIWIRYL